MNMSELVDKTSFEREKEEKKEAKLYRSCLNGTYCLEDKLNKFSHYSSFHNYNVSGERREETMKKAIFTFHIAKSEMMIMNHEEKRKSNM